MAALQKTLWINLPRASFALQASKRFGLYGRFSLQKPADFLVQSKAAVETCNSIREKFKSMDALSQPSAVLELLDKISNEVCTVIDAAELCRNTHSDKAFRDAGQFVFTKISIAVTR